MDEVRATIIDLIWGATRSRKVLLGGILKPYGDDYVLILPEGEDYLISVKPVPPTITDTAPAPTTDRGSAGE